MIFDRTQFDVENAKRLIEEKVKNFIPLLETEIETLERGCATKNTLNRIENAQSVLAQSLNSLGNAFSIQTKSWNEQDIFNEEEFERILFNLDVLKRYVIPKKDTPETPMISFSYLTFNDIEKIIFDLQTLEENMRKAFIYSGEIYSGEV